MTLDQLRLLIELAQARFNLTQAADKLGMSQSAASRRLQELEEELGMELVERAGRRILDLTEPGRVVLERAARVLSEADSLAGVVDEFCAKDEGTLVIAATHTQARYALPAAIVAFRKDFPKIKLHLHQAAPAEVAHMLVSGAADIGVATETLAEHADLSARPFYQWRHIVIAHKSHPLAGSAPVDLERLARWPLITYQQGFTGRARIDEAFAAGGLTPDVAITALDADVIKSYVELGLGVGIVAEMAYAPNRDSDLVRLDAGELFAVNTTWLAVKRGRLLRAYVRRFLDLASSG